VGIARRLGIDVSAVALFSRSYRRGRRRWSWKRPNCWYGLVDGCLFGRGAHAARYR
jgi:hypothetical protein